MSIGNIPPPLIGFIVVALLLLLSVAPPRLSIVLLPLFSMCWSFNQT